MELQGKKGRALNNQKHFLLLHSIRISFIAFSSSCTIQSSLSCSLSQLNSFYVVDCQLYDEFNVSRTILPSGWRTMKEFTAQTINELSKLFPRNTFTICKAKLDSSLNDLNKKVLFVARTFMMNSFEKTWLYVIWHEFPRLFQRVGVELIRQSRSEAALKNRIPFFVEASTPTVLDVASAVRKPFAHLENIRTLLQK